MLKVIYMIISCLMPSSLQTVSFPDDLGNWFSTAPPEISSTQWLIAQGDIKTEWDVYSDDMETVKVRLKSNARDQTPSLPFSIKPKGGGREFYGTRTFVKVADGYIVSFNNGEFGAELWWFSSDGNQRYNISSDHVVKFLSMKSGLFTLNGLAHGFGERGRICLLAKGDDGKWTSRLIAETSSAPHVAVKTKNENIIIATSNELLKFDPSVGKSEIIAGNLPWSGLYPNSIAISKNEFIYIGMRHGVSKVEKSGPVHKVRWLLPSKAVADEKLKPGFR